MAREGGGGGGAFGWTILGVIVGVAGTLAVETLMSRHATTETEQTPTSAAVAVVTPPAPPPAPVQAPVQPVSSTPAALSTDAGAPSHEDVQDDAAAAGMTSRSHTGDADSAAPNTN